jgi:exopolyphosphatase/guanosine-5'-triphosphate,3'-diphosphate pyrophosphatase
MATRFAIFDLGSNSIKFLVAEVTPDPGRPWPSILVIQERSVTTRLAENLLRTCELQPESIQRTLAALKELREEAAKLGATRFRAVATSAVRDSKNRKAFLREAKAVLGFPVELLSGDEEAETIFSGVSADPFWDGKDLLAFDIGGGSTEWIQGKGGKIERKLSLPLGCVRLKDRFSIEYPMAEAVRENLLKTVREQVSQGIADFRLENRRLVGTGGTLTCLAAIELSLGDFEPESVHHHVLTRDQVWALWVVLNKYTLDQLKLVPGLPAKRADLIIPGISVTLATMAALGTNEVCVSVRGLRYGVLEKLWKDEGSTKPVDEQVEEEA